jgi:hypothetical protein
MRSLGPPRAANASQAPSRPAVSVGFLFRQLTEGEGPDYAIPAECLSPELEHEVAPI